LPDHSSGNRCTLDPLFLENDNMKTETSELTGTALDWAVAKCEGIQDSEFVRTHMDAWPYSTDWSQGGPIIEREGISIVGFDPDPKQWNAHQYGIYLMENCPTPLIAAMRCYVAAKLGDDVVIPNELIGE